MKHVKHPQTQTGFTLVEMAIVLLIVTLLLYGLVPTISSQIEQKQRNETRKQLDEVRDALLGFVVAKGRLPCPANAANNGMESFCAAADPAPCGLPITDPVPSNERCYSPPAPLVPAVYDGFVPAATLGITATNNQGFAVDGWSNPIRYAVTVKNSGSFTKSNGMQATGMNSLNPDLHVCASATYIPAPPATNCGVSPPAVNLTTDAVAVIYSIGRDPVPAVTNTDELANLNLPADPVFVSHEPSPAGAPNGEFDDIVTWISPNILYNRMVTAGKLP
jgi:prepilin-type N-terminal cleavage/methylation domain-containing protein